VLSELWTAADCPVVKGSSARYPGFSRSTAGFLQSAGLLQIVVES
jgi:hypothetical protein